MSDSTAQQLRQQIAELVGRYADLQMAPKPFVAGQSSVPPAGKVIGAGEQDHRVPGITLCDKRRVMVQPRQHTDVCHIALQIGQH